MLHLVNSSSLLEEASVEETLVVSVIIPVKDGAAELPDCLEAILHQENIPGKFEIIVVDDGSQDNSAEVARQLDVKVISQKNTGPAAARNAGASAASAPILAFTDVDCAPSPKWLCSLLRPFADPQVMGVKGTYRTEQDSLVARFVQLEYQSKYQRMSRMKSIDFIDTYSAAYRREVFLQNGGFDPVFPVPSVEDQEFSYRLSRKGYRLVFAPDAAVYHRHDKSFGEYIQRKFGIGYWKAFMLNWMPEKTFSDSHTSPSQRWQILLSFAAISSLILGILYPPAVWVALACLLAFFFSAGPLLNLVARQDAAVLPVAPLLLVMRALSLGAGLLAGFVKPPAGKSRPATGLNMMSRLAKRALDVIGGLVGLIISSPVLLLSMVAVKMNDGGPVIFKQVRAGENGKPFQLFKLRTMVPGAEDQVDEVLDQNILNGPVYKIPDDPRVTKVGRFLRRWSLDELPQFWNVIRGEMSLVGPRPEEMWVVARYNDEQRQRLAVKPGLTGPMQISGRGNLDMDRRLALEVEYIRNYSIWKDISILLHSVPAVISGDGAY
jgi:lipopolysaccharide/colanic/teichoic acid biosynthesis glycosyltransferase/glycosyltransferase involved in cell wall biosynthesis